MTYVFVDTGAFERENYSFEHSAGLLGLVQAVKNQTVKVLLTDVTDREVKRRLSVRVRHGMQGINGHLSNLRVLRAVNIEPLRALDEDAAVSDAHAQWAKFLATLAPKFLSVDAVRPSEVLDAYFEQRPPFSPKKQNEFRDAFVLGALRIWSTESKQPVLVVSPDKDHRDTCDGAQLIYFERLTDALAYALKAPSSRVSVEQGPPPEPPGNVKPLTSDNANIPNFLAGVRELLRENEEFVAEFVSEEFASLSVQVEDDYDAEIDEVRVDKVSLDPGDFEVIAIDAPHLVIISGQVKVRFSVDATLSDYDNGSRDEGEWVYLPTEELTFSDEIWAQLAIKVPFGNGSEVDELGELTLEEPTSLELSKSHNEIVRRPSIDDHED
jgi:PIN domain